MSHLSGTVATARGAVHLLALSNAAALALLWGVVATAATAAVCGVLDATTGCLRLPGVCAPGTTATVQHLSLRQVADSARRARRSRGGVTLVRPGVRWRRLRTRRLHPRMSQRAVRPVPGHGHGVVCLRPPEDGTAMRRASGGRAQWSGAVDALPPPVQRAIAVRSSVPPCVSCTPTARR